ncbi:translation initiation factor IF-2-like [Myiozetetes cayanensis]|uniref:translation initiation factor IF-2-like n=1 Tax=Myiozetetes cayanensis TaxID=478635 RepID=UPI002160F90C|nr:translation initiation factor IF-2-like [Myiozetetes cayanensis]XP_050193546.1 translation initiation factor IF-2-like [Myiozetetes cayanensis]
MLAISAAGTPSPPLRAGPSELQRRSAGELPAPPKWRPRRACAVGLPLLLRRGRGSAAGAAPGRWRGRDGTGLGPGGAGGAAAAGALSAASSTLPPRGRVRCPPGDARGPPRWRPPRGAIPARRPLAPRFPARAGRAPARAGGGTTAGGPRGTAGAVVLSRLPPGPRPPPGEPRDTGRGKGDGALSGGLGRVRGSGGEV